MRLTKVQELLRRQSGRAVPYRTLHRFAVEELGFGKRHVTVRVEEGEAGQEVQVDFGRMGFLREEAQGKWRVVWGLVFTAVVQPSSVCLAFYTQTLAEVIARGLSVRGSFSARSSRL